MRVRKRVSKGKGERGRKEGRKNEKVRERGRVNRDLRVEEKEGKKEDSK